MPLNARGEVHAAVAALGFALGVWGAGLAVSRWLHPPGAAVARPDWVLPFTALPAEAQREYRLLREGVLELEEARGRTGQWPAPAAAEVEPFDDRWSLRAQGSLATYVLDGAPGEEGRWLVSFIEPDGAAPREEPPPEDEEHHTLPGGLGLHVTVWRQAVAGPVPAGVVAFPAVEGWQQVVGR